MLLTNSEIEKVRNKSCKIFDELIKNSCTDNISEEERDSKYNELIDEIVYLVEEIKECWKNYPNVLFGGVNDNVKNP